MVPSETASQEPRLTLPADGGGERWVLDLARAFLGSVTASNRKGLRGRLQAQAEVLARLPGVGGAMVVSFDDEGAPVTSGAHRLTLRDDAPELEILSSLQRALTPRLREGAWVEVDLSQVSREQDGTAWALPVPSAPGLVLVLLDPAASPALLAVIAAAAPFLAAAIRSCIHQEAWSRIEQLQRLAREAVGRQPWDLQNLVHELCRLFDAGVVTILLNEQNELRLSASTDSQIGAEGAVIYRPGEGLTGHVFATGEAVRLSNTKDRGEVRRVTGLNRQGPRYFERDHDGSVTVQFLGVPMRFGDKVVGVIRMSRREGVARFTLEDEKALQFFADFLGAALAPAWDLLLKRSILDSVTEAIAVTRRERNAEGRPVSRVVLANPGAEKLLGRPRREIEGRDAREVYAPDEYERIRQELRPARETARREGHGEHGPISSRMRRADGSLVPVIISYRVIVNKLVQPPTLYTIGIARDTSTIELRAEQHQRLLELLGAMKIAYFRADPDGITQESTPTDCAITGYSEEELRTLPRENLYPDPNIRTRLLRRTREHQGLMLRELVQMRRKGGELFWAEGDLRILKDREGDEIGSEGLYRDVSDRILLQGFINEDTGRVLTDGELFARLKQDAEFHLDYISSLSHQLQTPLGSLIETLRNFERGELSQRALVQRLPYVIGQAVVCTRLVRNLSYMDKILRDEPFRRARVSLAKLAIETKLDFLHLLNEKSLTLHIEGESLERHLSILGHDEMLRQVVVNLVDNAIKYSLPDTTIHIRGRGHRAGGAFEVSSQGLPVSAEEREKIFQRGFRTRGAQALVPHGTGLGLWLVRKIVEAHGATIRCFEVFENGKKRILFRIFFSGSGASPRR